MIDAASRAPTAGCRRFAVALLMGAWALAVPPVAAQSPAESAVALRASFLHGVAASGVAAPARPVFASMASATRTGTARPDTLTPADPWLGRDKVLHAAGSFLLTLSGQYVLTAKLDASEGGALPFAAGGTLSLGLAKEIADSRRPIRPLFSVRDLVADALGVALAVGLILL